MLTEDGLGDGELWMGRDTRAHGIKGGPGIGIHGCPVCCLVLFWFLGPSLLYSMYVYVNYMCVLCLQLGKGPVGVCPHPLRNGRVWDPFLFSGPLCMPHKQRLPKLHPSMHLHESFHAGWSLLQLSMQLQRQLLSALLHHFFFVFFEMLHPTVQLHESVCDVLLHPYEPAEAADLKLPVDLQQCPKQEGHWNDSGGRGSHRYHSSGHEGTTRGQEGGYRPTLPVVPPADPPDSGPESGPGSSHGSDGGSSLQPWEIPVPDTESEGSSTPSEPGEEGAYEPSDIPSNPIERITEASSSGVCEKTNIFQLNVTKLTHKVIKY